MVYIRSFASDNHAGIHPEVLKAIERANVGDAIAYGGDVYSERAKRLFQEHFGDDCEVYFVFNGTGANITGLKAVTQSYHAVICAETAHIHSDECGAAENVIGCKLLTVPSADGKITVDQVQGFLHDIGNAHHSQPKVISISQVTEYGTVYRPEEIQALADFAHANGLYLYMDGSRLANAAASLGVEFREITTDVGVDVLSFGGTKNGLMVGEAVIFLNKALGQDFPFIHKQSLQLASKMRFIAAQFEALLTDRLWYRNACHANRMAKLLADELEKIPAVQITQKVEANAVFAIIPPPIVTKLQEKYLISLWSEARSEVRLMASFNTEDRDIHQLVDDLRSAINATHI